MQNIGNMNEAEIFQRDTDEYINSVLKSLFPNISSYMAFRSPHEISVRLSGDSLIKSVPEYNPGAKSFIHFTSLQALHSILNEQVIRMYNLNGANDPNELSHALTDLDLPDAELNEFRNQLYFLSMCNSDVLQSDSVLNLWRLYGNEGWGVAIEFEIDPMKINNGNNNFILAKLIYKKLDLKTFAKANSEFENKTKLRVDLKEVLQVPACLHKSQYFKVEEEVRLIHLAGSGLDIFTSFGTEHYRYDFNKRNENVSYYRLKIDKDDNEYHLPNIQIKKVQLGFRYELSQYENIKNHLLEICSAISFAKNKFIKFEIEQSPLKNIYR
jgi:hypothetical protein